MSSSAASSSASSSSAIESSRTSALSSNLGSISAAGSHDMASRAATPTFVNMAAVIGEDVTIDCPLLDAIAWLKGK